MAYSGKTITLSQIASNNQVPIEGKALGDYLLSQNLLVKMKIIG